MPSFNAYHKWLGIRPEEQPANHYRLLGINVFESDADVIASAADQRMGHVRLYQAGEHAAFSQRILNELAMARVCLLNPEKKLAYDQALRAQLAPPPAVTESVESPVIAEPRNVIPDLSFAPTYRKLYKKSTPFYLPWVLSGFGGLMVIAVLVVIARSDRNEQKTVRTPPTTAVAEEPSPKKAKPTVVNSPNTQLKK